MSSTAVFNFSYVPLLVLLFKNSVEAEVSYLNILGSVL